MLLLALGKEINKSQPYHYHIHIHMAREINLKQPFNDHVLAQHMNMKFNLIIN